MSSISALASTHLSKSILIHAPAAKVWEAVTQPERIKQWMADADMDIISDWKAGSPIIFRTELSGHPFENKGTILQMEPEEIFQYNYWSAITRLPDVPENYAVITFQLLPQETGTLLHLQLDNLIAYTSYEHSELYWNATLRILKDFVEGMER